MEMQSGFLSQEMKLQFERGKTQRHKKARPPKEAYYYIPRETELVEFNENNPSKTLRKIFEGGVPYNYYELIKLKELKKEIERHNLNAKRKSRINLPNNWKDSNSLRFLQGTGYNIPKTIEALNEHIEWRKNYLPGKINENGMEILNLGFIYINGRDSRFRPIITIVANIYEENKKDYSFSDWERAIIYFLEYTIRHLLIPGQVENWDIICDMKDIAITSIPDELKKLLMMLQNNYRCRLFVMYIINMGGWISFGWSIIKKFVTPSTERKIKILKPNNLNELFFYINPTQIEKKFGGMAEDIKSFYFPPIFPSNNYLLPNEKKNSILLDEEVYNALLKNNKDMIRSPYLSEQGIIDEEKDDDFEDSIKNLIMNNVSCISTQQYITQYDFTLSNGLGLVEINLNNHSNFIPNNRNSCEFLDLRDNVEMERITNVDSAQRLSKNTIRQVENFDIKKIDRTINNCPIILKNGFIDPSRNKRRSKPPANDKTESTYTSKIEIENVPDGKQISKSTNEEEKPIGIENIENKQENLENLENLDQIKVDGNTQRVCCSAGAAPEKKWRCLIM